MKHIFVLALLLSASLFSSRATAQAWQQTNGPGGVGINAVAVNSQGHIFVVSSALHRTTDNGATWTQIAIGLWGLVDIKIKPTGEIFLLATHDGSIFYLYRSVDNGNSWKSILNYPLTPSFLNILPDGSLFILASTLPSFTKNGYISKDNGDTWTKLTGENTQNLWANKAGYLFLSTDVGFYRSTDSGQNWSKVVNGINTTVSAFGEAPNGVLYAGINYDYNTSNPSVLFQSVDSGRVWTALNFRADDSRQVNQIIISKQGRIVVNLDDFDAISDDNGKTWRSEIAYAIAHVSNSGIFYLFGGPTLVSTTLDTGAAKQNFVIPNGNITSLLEYEGILLSGIWRSLDGGKNWVTSSGGITQANAIDSSKNILIGAGGYVLRSLDSGITWKRISLQLTLGDITAINVRNKGEIFVSIAGEGIFRSIDNGVTWDQLNIGITNQNIFSLAVHQNGDVYAGSQNIIYKSTDVGLHWTQLTTNFPKGAGNVSTLVVNTQGNIIAGVDNAGVFWSTDNGTTWALKALGLNATKINALVSTPSGKVFAATNSGIFFLDIIPGANWIQLNSGLTATNILSLCRDQSGRLFAGTDVSGVFSSINTFNIAHPNGSLAMPNLIVPANGSINAPLNVKYIWSPVPKAKTYQVTISKTSDFSTIETMSDYLTDTAFSFEVKDFSTTYYWRVQAIGEGEVSLYSESWNFTTSSNADVKQTNSNQTATSLGANYPNPFSLSTTIPFTLGERSFITLEVFDQLGRSCAMLANGSYNPGSYEAKFSADNLSSGMYFVRLKTEKESLIKGIEIVK